MEKESRGHLLKPVWKARSVRGGCDVVGRNVNGSEVADGKEGRHRNIEAVSVDVSSSLWEARSHAKIN
jgi:hypothetical protein